jgi:hypothetical protein
VGSPLLRASAAEMYAVKTFILIIFLFHMFSFFLFQGLTPVILTTQEAEIKKISVQGQPRQKVQETDLNQ